YLRMEDDSVSFASTPDAAGLQITDRVDIRVDCQLSTYVPTMLALKWGGTAQSWQLALNGDGTLILFWWTGSVTASARSTQPIPLLGRITLRAVLNAAGQTVAFFTGTSGAGGSFTTLGAAIATGATTLSGGVGQAVQVGLGNAFFAGFNGQVYEVQVLGG